MMRDLVERLVWSTPDPRSPVELAREIDEELEAHVAHTMAALIHEGWSEEEARAEAEQRLGDRALIRVRCLEVAKEDRVLMQRAQLVVLSLVVVAVIGLAWKVVPAQDRQGVALSRISEQLGALEVTLRAGVGLGGAPLAAASAVSSEADDSRADELIRLNRTGQWAEATRLGEEILEEPSTPPSTRARVGVHLAHAYSCLNRTEEARRALDIYVAHQGALPKSDWCHEAATELRSDVGVGEEESVPEHRSTLGGETKATLEALPVARPEEVGLSDEIVEQHRAHCEATGADACLVVKDGVIVSEWYGERYRAPVHAMSSTKSITSLLVGLLIREGKLESIDVPVGRFIPEWSTGSKAKVTLRHLLSQTSGLPELADTSVGFVSDKNRFAIDQELAGEPGSFFAYSNEGVQLLSPVLDVVAGEPIQDYARRRLFVPIGMKDSRLNIDGAGHAWTYADMKTTPRDLARIGLLMLGKGAIGGERIVSAEWVQESTRPSQDFRDDYGLLWWLIEEPKGFAAMGYLDTNVYVFPDRELVIVRTQSKPVEGAGSYEPAALKMFGQM